MTAAVTGITRPNLSEWVADTVFGRYVHPIILPYYEEVLMEDGKRVAVITIGQEVSKPYVVRHQGAETAYIRIGSISRPATREQLLMLGAASGFIHTEIMPVNRTSFDSLDKARLENYLQDILHDPEIPGSREEWIERLNSLGFMTDGVTEEPVCTIAGLVLFGVRPRQILKQSGIRLVFFDSDDKEYQARLDKILDAPLVGRFQVGKAGKSLIDPGLIEKALESMEPFISQEPNNIDEHLRRPRRWHYPLEAIRELMINALVHRDWTRFVDVEITGYRDRLEIISPGALPNSMTIEKMLAGRRSARNSLMVEVLRDYGYVDARGMGVRTKVLPALRRSGVELDVEATGDFVKSVIGKISGQGEPLNDPINDPLSDTEDPRDADHVGKASDKCRKSGGTTSEKIREACREKPSITIAELAETIGVTPRTVERNIRELQSKGLLRRAGGRKEGHWEIL